MKMRRRRRRALALLALPFIAEAQRTHRTPVVASLKYDRFGAAPALASANEGRQVVANSNVKYLHGFTTSPSVFIDADKLVVEMPPAYDHYAVARGSAQSTVDFIMDLLPVLFDFAVKYQRKGESDAANAAYLSAAAALQRKWGECDHDFVLRPVAEMVFGRNFDSKIARMKEAFRKFQSSWNQAASDPIKFLKELVTSAIELFNEVFGAVFGTGEGGESPEQVAGGAAAADVTANIEEGAHFLVRFRIDLVAPQAAEDVLGATGFVQLAREAQQVVTAIPKGALVAIHEGSPESKLITVAGACSRCLNCHKSDTCYYSQYDDLQTAVIGKGGHPDSGFHGHYKERKGKGSLPLGALGVYVPEGVADGSTPTLDQVLVHDKKEKNTAVIEVFAFASERDLVLVQRFRRENPAEEGSKRQFVLKPWHDRCSASGLSDLVYELKPQNALLNAKRVVITEKDVHPQFPRRAATKDRALKHVPDAVKADFSVAAIIEAAVTKAITKRLLSKRANNVLSSLAEDLDKCLKNEVSNLSLKEFTFDKAREILARIMNALNNARFILQDCLGSPALPKLEPGSVVELVGITPGSSESKKTTDGKSSHELAYGQLYTLQKGYTPGDSRVDVVLQDDSSKAFNLQVEWFRKHSIDYTAGKLTELGAKDIWTWFQKFFLEAVNDMIGWDWLSPRVRAVMTATHDAFKEMPSPDPFRITSMTFAQVEAGFFWSGLLLQNVVFCIGELFGADALPKALPKTSQLEMIVTPDKDELGKAGLKDFEKVFSYGDSFKLTTEFSGDKPESLLELQYEVAPFASVQPGHEYYFSDERKVVVKAVSHSDFSKMKAGEIVFLVKAAGLPDPDKDRIRAAHRKPVVEDGLAFKVDGVRSVDGVEQLSVDLNGHKFWLPAENLQVPISVKFLDHTTPPKLLTEAAWLEHQPRKLQQDLHLPAKLFRVRRAQPTKEVTISQWARGMVGEAFQRLKDHAMEKWGPILKRKIIPARAEAVAVKLLNDFSNDVGKRLFNGFKTKDEFQEALDDLWQCFRDLLFVIQTITHPGSNVLPAWLPADSVLELVTDPDDPSGKQIDDEKIIKLVKSQEAPLRLRVANHYFFDKGSKIDLTVDDYDDKTIIDFADAALGIGREVSLLVSPQAPRQKATVTGFTEDAGARTKVHLKLAGTGKLVQYDQAQWDAKQPCEASRAGLDKLQVDPRFLRPVSLALPPLWADLRKDGAVVLKNVEQLTGKVKDLTLLASLKNDAEFLLHQDYIGGLPHSGMVQVVRSPRKAGAQPFDLPVDHLLLPHLKEGSVLKHKRDDVTLAGDLFYNAAFPETVQVVHRTRGKIQVKVKELRAENPGGSASGIQDWVVHNTISRLFPAPIQKIFFDLMKQLQTDKDELFAKVLKSETPIFQRVSNAFAAAKQILSKLFSESGYMIGYVAGSHRGLDLAKLKIDDELKYICHEDCVTTQFSYGNRVKVSKLPPNAKHVAYIQVDFQPPGGVTKSGLVPVSHLRHVEPDRPQPAAASKPSMADYAGHPEFNTPLLLIQGAQEVAAKTEGYMDQFDLPREPSSDEVISRLPKYIRLAGTLVSKGGHLATILPVLQWMFSVASGTHTLARGNLVQVMTDGDAPGQSKLSPGSSWVVVSDRPKDHAWDSAEVSLVGGCAACRGAHAHAEGACPFWGMDRIEVSSKNEMQVNRPFFSEMDSKTKWSATWLEITAVDPAAGTVTWKIDGGQGDQTEHTEAMGDLKKRVLFIQKIVSGPQLAGAKAPRQPPREYDGGDLDDGMFVSCLEGKWDGRVFISRPLWWKIESVDPDTVTISRAPGEAGQPMPRDEFAAGCEFFFPSGGNIEPYKSQEPEQDALVSFKRYWQEFEDIDIDIPVLVRDCQGAGCFTLDQHLHPDLFKPRYFPKAHCIALTDQTNRRIIHPARGQAPTEIEYNHFSMSLEASQKAFGDATGQYSFFHAKSSCKMCGGTGQYQKIDETSTPCICEKTGYVDHFTIGNHFTGIEYYYLARTASGEFKRFVFAPESIKADDPQLKQALPDAWLLAVHARKEKKTIHVYRQDYSRPAELESGIAYELSYVFPSFDSTEAGDPHIVVVKPTGWFWYRHQVRAAISLDDPRVQVETKVCRAHNSAFLTEMCWKVTAKTAQQVNFGTFPVTDGALSVDAWHLEDDLSDKPFKTSPRHVRLVADKPGVLPTKTQQEPPLRPAVRGLPSAPVVLYNSNWHSELYQLLEYNGVISSSFKTRLGCTVLFAFGSFLVTSGVSATLGLASGVSLAVLPLQIGGITYQLTAEGVGGIVSQVKKRWDALKKGGEWSLAAGGVNFAFHTVKALLGSLPTGVSIVGAFVGAVAAFCNRRPILDYASVMTSKFFSFISWIFGRGDCCQACRGKMVTRHGRPCPCQKTFLDKHARVDCEKCKATGKVNSDLLRCTECLGVGKRAWPCQKCNRGRHDPDCICSKPVPHGRTVQKCSDCQGSGRRQTSFVQLQQTEVQSTSFVQSQQPPQQPPPQQEPECGSCKGTGLRSVLQAAAKVMGNQMALRAEEASLDAIERSKKFMGLDLNKQLIVILQSGLPEYAVRERVVTELVDFITKQQDAVAALQGQEKKKELVQVLLKDNNIKALERYQVGGDDVNINFFGNDGLQDLVDPDLQKQLFSNYKATRDVIVPHRDVSLALQQVIPSSLAVTFVSLGYIIGFVPWYSVVPAAGVILWDMKRLHSYIKHGTQSTNIVVYAPHFLYRIWCAVCAFMQKTRALASSGPSKSQATHKKAFSNVLKVLMVVFAMISLCLVVMNFGGEMLSGLSTVTGVMVSGLNAATNFHGQTGSRFLGFQQHFGPFEERDPRSSAFYGQGDEITGIDEDIVSKVFSLPEQQYSLLGDVSGRGYPTVENGQKLSFQGRPVQPHSPTELSLEERLSQLKKALDKKKNAMLDQKRIVDEREQLWEAAKKKLANAWVTKTWLWDHTQAEIDAKVAYDEAHKAYQQAEKAYKEAQDQHREVQAELLKSNDKPQEETTISNNDDSDKHGYQGVSEKPGGQGEQDDAQKHEKMESIKTEAVGHKDNQIISNPGDDALKNGQAPSETRKDIESDVLAKLTPEQKRLLYGDPLGLHSSLEKTSQNLREAHPLSAAEEAAKVLEQQLAQSKKELHEKRLTMLDQKNQMLNRQQEWNTARTNLESVRFNPNDFFGWKKAEKDAKQLYVLAKDAFRDAQKEYQDKQADHDVLAQHSKSLRTDLEANANSQRKPATIAKKPQQNDPLKSNVEDADKQGDQDDAQNQEKTQNTKTEVKADQPREIVTNPDGDDPKTDQAPSRIRKIISQGDDDNQGLLFSTNSPQDSHIKKPVDHAKEAFKKRGRGDEEPLHQQSPEQPTISDGANYKPNGLTSTNGPLQKDLDLSDVHLQPLVQPLQSPAQRTISDWANYKPNGLTFPEIPMQQELDLPDVRLQPLDQFPVSNHNEPPLTDWPQSLALQESYQKISDFNKQMSHIIPPHHVTSAHMSAVTAKLNWPAALRDGLNEILKTKNQPTIQLLADRGFTHEHARICYVDTGPKIASEIFWQFGVHLGVISPDASQGIQMDAAQGALLQDFSRAGQQLVTGEELTPFSQVTQTILAGSLQKYSEQLALGSVDGRVGHESTNLFMKLIIKQVRPLYEDLLRGTNDAQTQVLKQIVRRDDSALVSTCFGQMQVGELRAYMNAMGGKIQQTTQILCFVEQVGVHDPAHAKQLFNGIAGMLVSQPHLFMNELQDFVTSLAVVNKFNASPQLKFQLQSDVVLDVAGPLIKMQTPADQPKVSFVSGFFQTVQSVFAPPAADNLPSSAFQNKPWIPTPMSNVERLLTAKLKSIPKIKLTTQLALTRIQPVFQVATSTLTVVSCLANPDITACDPEQFQHAQTVMFNQAEQLFTHVGRKIPGLAEQGRKLLQEKVTAIVDPKTVTSAARNTLMTVAQSVQNLLSNPDMLLPLATVMMETGQMQPLAVWFCLDLFASNTSSLVTLAGNKIGSFMSLFRGNEKAQQTILDQVGFKVQPAHHALAENFMVSTCEKISNFSATIQKEFATVLKGNFDAAQFQAGMLTFAVKEFNREYKKLEDGANALAIQHIEEEVVAQMQKVFGICLTGLMVAQPLDMLEERPEFEFDFVQPQHDGPDDEQQSDQTFEVIEIPDTLQKINVSDREKKNDVTDREKKPEDEPKIDEEGPRTDKEDDGSDQLEHQDAQSQTNHNVVRDKSNTEQQTRTTDDKTASDLKNVKPHSEENKNPPYRALNKEQDRLERRNSGLPRHFLEPFVPESIQKRLKERRLSDPFHDRPGSASDRSQSQTSLHTAKNGAESDRSPSPTSLNTAKNGAESYKPPTNDAVSDKELVSDKSQSNTKATTKLDDPQLGDDDRVFDRLEDGIDDGENVFDALKDLNEDAEQNLLQQQTEKEDAGKKLHQRQPKEEQEGVQGLQQEQQQEDEQTVLKRNLEDLEKALEDAETELQRLYKWLQMDVAQI